MRTSIAGLLLAVLAFTACSGSKKNCAVDTDCGNGQFCAPAGCTWGCFQEGVGCREGGWCHPVSGQCMSELPSLTDFTATPSSIIRGASSTLTWSVLGADKVTLEPGGIDVTEVSAFPVSPTTTTVYTITAENEFGPVSTNLTVVVSIACTEENECTAANLTCNEKWGICVAPSCASQSDFTPCEVLFPKYSYNICVSGQCVEPGCGNETCNVPGPHFPLADTGQRKCYDATAALVSCPALGTDFYGQDAQYGWDKAHYANERYARDTSVNTEPIVVDHVTGLTWQDGFTKDPTTWEEALSYCDTLSWGNFTDWRLPDPYELTSIVEADHVAPAIDHVVFTAMPTTTPHFWTSSSRGDNVCFLSFEELFMGYNPPRSPKKYARCIRSEPASGPAQRYVRTSPVSGNPIVTDSVSQLVWQGCRAGLSGDDCGTSAKPAQCANSNGNCNWQEALSECEALDWGGHQDWRLPSIKELQTIVDDRRTSPPFIDIQMFPGTSAPSGSFWSSTSRTKDASYAWYLRFDPQDGISYTGKGARGSYVRCVRNGP